MGWTSSRSIARFRWRAPYLESVPSFSRNSRAMSVTVHVKRRFRGGRFQPPVDQIQLDVQNPAQLLVAERLEHNDSVQAVDKLRRELAAGRGDADTDIAGLRSSWKSASPAWGSESPACGELNGAHFRGAQIAGQEDHRRREIHLAVVA